MIMMMMMMMREKGRRCTKGLFTSLPLPRGSPPRYFLLKTTFEILHLFSSARLAYSLDLYFSKYYPRNVQWILARISWDGPEVSTQAENPVEFVHSSQTVTAWSMERVMALDREGATWTNTSSAEKGGENIFELHWKVLSSGITKVTFPYRRSGEEIGFCPKSEKLGKVNIE